MVMVELDIGIIPAPIPPIIKVSLVDHCFLIVTVMIEVDIGLRPDNFIHFTMLDYTFLIQGSHKNIY